jgi:hypothetical protein
MRAALVAAAVGALGVVLASAACTDQAPTCIARGTTRGLAGSAAYSGQATPAAASSETRLDGSEGAAVTIDDYWPSCTFDGMEFTLHIGECDLWFTLAGTSTTTRGTFLGATALAESSQACTLHLPEGAARIAIAQGTLTAGPVSWELLLDGDVSQLDGAPAHGHLHWDFTGQAQAQ